MLSFSSVYDLKLMNPPLHLYYTRAVHRGLLLLLFFFCVFEDPKFKLYDAETHCIMDFCCCLSVYLATIIEIPHVNQIIKLKFATMILIRVKV